MAAAAYRRRSEGRANLSSPGRFLPRYKRRCAGSVNICNKDLAPSKVWDKTLRRLLINNRIFGKGKLGLSKQPTRLRLGLGEAREGEIMDGASEQIQ